MSNKISLKPSPAESVRMIRLILSKAFGFDDSLQSDLAILIWWKRYEKLVDDMGAYSADLSKELQRELLHYALLHPTIFLREDPARDDLVIPDDWAWDKVEYYLFVDTVILEDDLPTYLREMQQEFPQRYEDDYLRGDHAARDGYIYDAEKLYGGRRA